MLNDKYDFKKVEEGKYDFWLSKNYFECGDKRKEPFSIVIPPPNVTGNLHLGHALDTSLQDVIIRYKKLCGYDTLWLPGMDHAAIATESKVVNKLKNEGIDKYELGREKFLEECWKWKEEHSNNIRNQWKKLGLSLDYRKERFTLDEGLNKAVNTVFLKLYEKGWIYRGKKIINWDPIAMTALSNEEVIYKEEKSKLYYLKYKFENSEGYITVATTRPETIFGDVAVAVNDEDEKYKDVIGNNVIVPLVNRVVPIIADSRVLKDFGTGALKITPAHAIDDYEIGITHNLEIINTITPDGHLNEYAKPYEGLSLDEARKKIVEDLTKQNLIVKEEEYTHSVGHSERTGATVEPYLSEQWFVKMDELSKNLLENQKTKDKINFIPPRFEKILNHWMEDCHDWCISRQLWWGHRIPVWYKNDEIYVGLEAPKEPGWVQDNDVLDTWFSSALWPFSTLGWPSETEDIKRYFPTNVLVTGYDIIFFWVARMAFTSLEFMGKSPFKYCLIHGLIRDKQGRKMSKSLGNGVDPMEMIDKYGADALRFYLTTTGSIGMDLRFDEEKLLSITKFINKLWNASKFVLMNITDIKDTNIDLENLKIEDKWILTELNNTIKEIRKSMDKYRFNDAGNKLYEFIWNKFCDWYIELTKGRNDLNCQKILLKILTNILQMLHPFMPFVTEEIYKSLPISEESIMITEYPKYNKKEVFLEEFKLTEETIENITNIRNYKVENNISKETACKLTTKEEIKEILIKMLKLNIDESSTGSAIIYSSSLVKIEFYISDSNKEEQTLKIKDEIEKLKQSIEKREKLLQNENYINKAPKNIVDLDREKLKKEKEELAILLDKISK